MLKHCSSNYVAESRQSLHQASLYQSSVLNSSLHHSSLQWSSLQHSSISKSSSLKKSSSNKSSLHKSLLHRSSFHQSSPILDSNNPYSQEDASDCLATFHRGNNNDSDKKWKEKEKEYCDAEKNENKGDITATSNTIKVYTSCLLPSLAYKTVVITPHTTTSQVIMGLLRRFRMKHRDPKLFFLTMELTINQTFQTIKLEDNSLLGDMISCNPWEGGKFILCCKTGGRVKIYDHHIRSDSVYKSFIISRDTTVRDTLTMFCLSSPHLHPADLTLTHWARPQGEQVLDGGDYPLQVMESWQDNMEHRFVIKLAQEDIYDDCDSDKSLSDNFQQQEDNQIYIRQQAFMKKMFSTTMICEDSDKHILTLKNEMSRKDPFDGVFVHLFLGAHNTL